MDAPVDGQLKSAGRRRRRRTIGVFALGVLCGIALSWLLVALTGGEIHVPNDRDEQTAQKREALMEALEVAARQQPLLSDVEVLITLTGRGMCICRPR